MILTPLLATTLQGLIDDESLDINYDLTKAMIKYKDTSIQEKAKFIIENNDLVATTLLTQIPSVINYYDYSLEIYTSFFDWIYEWCVLVLGDNYGGDKKFISTLLSSTRYLDSVNQSIDTSISTLGVGRYTFTSSDDLASGGLTGVTTDTKAFAEDLKNTGELIDLANISRYGWPQALIEAMMRTNSINQIETEFEVFGMNVNDLTNAINNNPGKPLLPTVQKRIYDMAATITGTKLSNIIAIMGIDIPQNKVSLNNPNTQLYKQEGNIFQPYYGGDCRGGLYYRYGNNYYPTSENYSLPNNTMVDNGGEGIFTLADLMNTKKIFPNSYNTIKNPIEDEFVYNESGGNSYWTDDLPAPMASAMPADIARANEAFSRSLRNIKNITRVNINDLSVIFDNIETTTGLDRINDLTRAIEPETVGEVINTLGGGSNVNGTYFLTDFVGSPTGEDHTETFTILSNFEEIYDLTPLDDAMNAVISGDANAYTDLATVVNDILGDPEYIKCKQAYNTSIERIIFEQRNLELALVDLYSFLSSTLGVIGFAESLHRYSNRTNEKDMVHVLEHLALPTLTGDALIAAMIEGRNLQKLDNNGIQTDSRVATPGYLG